MPIRVETGDRSYKLPVYNTTIASREMYREKFRTDDTTTRGTCRASHLLHSSVKAIICESFCFFAAVTTGFRDNVIIILLFFNLSVANKVWNYYGKYYK